MGCSDSDYDFLRRLVRARSANVVAPAGNALFENRLKPIARTAGAANLKELVGLLRSNPSPHLQRTVAEAMTIHETSFFRDKSVFDVLGETVLPHLLEANSSQRRLRIWSAAASTGQEAYSVAMLLSERFQQLAGWDVKIIGTDVALNAVEEARRGVYRRMDVNRGLPARLLLKYFNRSGDEWEIAPGLRAMCEFQHANLCGPLPPLPQFDLVLLRNVLLYFTPEDRGAAFQNVDSRMSANGYLVLGASEQAEDSTRLFEPEFAGGCYFYRRAARR